MKNKEKTTILMPTVLPIESMSVLDLIRLTGKLKYSVSQTLSVLKSKLEKEELKKLDINLCTKGTDEYNAYTNGLLLGDLEIENALQVSAASGDIDAIATLKETQRQKEIKEVVRREFFSNND